MLRDPEKRERYDRLGANWKAGQDVSGASGFVGGIRRAERATSATCASSSAAAEATSATSSRACSEAAAGARPAHGGFGGFEGFSTRGADQEAELELSLEEAARGGRRRISLGDGRDYEVNIPPGVRDGQRIRLAGEGGRGAGGGPSGDLFLRVRIKPHPALSRRGPRPLHRSSGDALGGGARRHGRGADPRRDDAGEGAAGLVHRPQAAAARRGLPGPARRPRRPLRGASRSRCRSSPTDEERELFERLAEVSSFNPRETL